MIIFDIPLLQDLTATWGQQVDPWNADYGYGQGYDAYAYGATHDPSLYAYNDVLNWLKQLLSMMILELLDLVHFGHFKPFCFSCMIQYC